MSYVWSVIILFHKEQSYTIVWRPRTAPFWEQPCPSERPQLSAQLPWEDRSPAYLGLEVSFLWGGQDICGCDVQVHESLPERRPVARFTLPKIKKTIYASWKSWSGGWRLYSTLWSTFGFPQNGHLVDKSWRSEGWKGNVIRRSHYWWEGSLARVPGPKGC